MNYPLSILQLIYIFLACVLQFAVGLFIGFYGGKESLGVKEEIPQNDITKILFFQLSVVILILVSILIPYL